jgi:hypothetical protein
MLPRPPFQENGPSSWKQLLSNHTVHRPPPILVRDYLHVRSDPFDKFTSISRTPPIANSLTPGWRPVPWVEPVSLPIEPRRNPIPRALDWRIMKLPASYSTHLASCQFASERPGLTSLPCSKLSARFDQEGRRAMTSTSTRTSLVTKPHTTVERAGYGSEKNSE